MQIDVAPETARLLREEIDSGRCGSVDELIRAGLEAWREKCLALGAGTAPGEPRRHISEVIREIMSDVPSEVMAAMPKDGASQHDHYIYGLPKKEQ